MAVSRRNVLKAAVGMTAVASMQPLNALSTFKKVEKSPMLLTLAPFIQ